MATGRAPSERLQRRVSELSTCPICMDQLQNAKLLPCLHTFCLQCLRDLWKDISRGQRVQCPVCRQTFSIPPNGLGALQNNFFVQSLLDAAGNETGTGSACERHPDKPVQMYCVSCEVMICRRCQAANHRNDDHDCQVFS